MSQWQDFYNSVKDGSWPPCESENNYHQLPDWIRQECENIHGYRPTPVFPIDTATSCHLKWTWSTVFLHTNTTSTCPLKSNSHVIDFSVVDFHNTALKIQDRKNMLLGQWPERGCESCQQSEKLHGTSERLRHKNTGSYSLPPQELIDNPNAVQVTPRIVEVYFDNSCNLKCVYCGEGFSSSWYEENKKYPESKIIPIGFDGIKSKTVHENAQHFFSWFKINRQHLTDLTIIGGEPLCQYQFYQLLDILEDHPASELNLQIVTNLNDVDTQSKLSEIIFKIESLITRGHLKKFTVHASLDCIGAEAEYIRFPLNVKIWIQNFELLLRHHWIDLVIRSSVTPLTIKPMAEFVRQVNQWRAVRPIEQRFLAIAGPTYMAPISFGKSLEQDFDCVLALVPQDDDNRQMLEHIKQECKKHELNTDSVSKLIQFLNEIDHRRGTNWRSIFPWLDELRSSQ